jgi:hypothetical protein
MTPTMPGNFGATSTKPLLTSMLQCWLGRQSQKEVFSVFFVSQQQGRRLAAPRDVQREQSARVVIASSVRGGGEPYFNAQLFSKMPRDAFSSSSSFEMLRSAGDDNTILSTHSRHKPTTTTTTTHNSRQQPNTALPSKTDDTSN